MSLTLPSHERYEEGSQIRRSSKSVSSNIVEGYALRRCKAEFVHYLLRAYGSGQETIEHLELLFDTGSLQDKDLCEDLLSEYNELVGKLPRYIQAVDDSSEMLLFMKEPEIEYMVDSAESNDKKPSNP
jgi:four helix bundle protein